MLAVIKSVALTGLEGCLVQIEVDVTNGLPNFEIVGLPDASIRESRERVRSAIRNSGFEFPMKRITVNLAPADLRKEGPMFDLPIAVGLLYATDQLEFSPKWQEYVYLGELALDGKIRGVTGVLPSVVVAKEKGITGLVVPVVNADEASLVEDLEIYAVDSLRTVVSAVQGEIQLSRHHVNMNALMNSSASGFGDFSEVKGQTMAKRALEVAAAGGHNLFRLWHKVIQVISVGQVTEA